MTDDEDDDIEGTEVLHTLVVGMTDDEQDDDIEGMPFYCERCGYAAIGTGNLCQACQREEDASEGVGVQTMYAGRYDGHDN